MKKTLYVNRPLLNSDDIIAWAKAQGLVTMLDPEELHVTICYSKEKFDWEYITPDEEELVVPEISPKDKNPPVRQIEMFGKDYNVLVLQFGSDELHDRWTDLCEYGASFDFPDYKSHITITYDGADIDIDEIEPYQGKLVFGPEEFSEINTNWADDTKEISLTESHLVERTEMANGVRVHLNPSAGQLAQMCDRNDLRGICDDTNVYVWPAYSGVHLHMMHSLGISANYYDRRFYAFLPEFNERKRDWDDRTDVGNEYETIRGGVVIGARKHSFPLIKKVSATERWFAPRTVMTEASSSPLPNKFWLVFDIPSGKEANNEQLSQISEGVLYGVRGISDTKQIMTDWFLMGRNSVLFMDPLKVAELNDIEQIQYDDPEYLCSNNMAALFRIWAKEGKTRNNTGMFQNLVMYFIKSLGKTNKNAAYQLDYYGMAWKLADRYSKELPVINNVNELTDTLYRYLCDPIGSGFRDVEFSKELSLMKDDIRLAVYDMLRSVGKIYADEGEWLISSDKFVIPDNSILLVGVDPKTQAEYPEWKAKIDKNPNYMHPRSYSFESYGRLMTRIEEYDLRSKYVIKFVDARKFENNRSNIISRRRKS